MSAEKGTLRLVAEHLAEAVAPLDRVFRDGDAFRTVMWRLGWEVDGVPQSYVAVADAARSALTAMNALADGAGVLEVLDVIDAAGAVYRAVTDLTEAPSGVESGPFLSEIARQLFEHLLAEYLASRVPALFSTLEAAGVIAFEDVPPASGRPGFVRTRFAWQTIPDTLADPDSIPARVFAWGTAAFDFGLVAEIASELFDAIDLPSSVDRVAADLAEAIQAQAAGTPAGPIQHAVTISLFDLPLAGTSQEVAVSLTELPAEGVALPGLLIRLLVPHGIPPRVDIGAGWTFALRAGTDLSEELAVVLRPGETAARYPWAPGRPFPSAGFGASLTYDAGTPFVVFGEPGGIRLELARATCSADLDLGGDGLELTLGVEPGGLALVLSAAALDSFLGSLLGLAEARIEVPLALGWSSRTGLDFLGGAGFEVSIPLDIGAGGLRVDRVDLAIRFVAGAGVTPEVALRAAVACSGAVGPIVFSADGLGAELPIAFHDGNAGPFDIGFRVRWPTGLGIGVDAAGVVTGGGFLDIDVAAGRYAGVATLQMLGVGLTAIGIIQTTLPDGSEGWSLFLSLSAAFTGLQLGFGFTLNGVGGLLGVNRAVDLEALSDGVRTGALDSVLFPDDPIADATRILSDLDAIFPPAVGQYVIGPVAEIGWGTPTLVAVELGIIIQLPEPLTISLVGSVEAVLPDDELALLELRIDVAGTLNLTEGTLAIDASLRDSRVVGLALTGDTAVRASFLDNPSLLMACGGFNPHFTPPDDFPELARLSVALDTGDTLRLAISGYFALTSNTIQFGAAVDLWAQVSEITAEGRFSFDALVYFNPFGFVIDYGFSVSVSVGALELCGVHLALTLEGPNPWYALGTAVVTVLGVDTPFRVEETIGRKEVEGPRATVSARTLLIEALENPEAWTEVPPGADASAVVLGTGAPSDPSVRVHPAGMLEVRQGVVPLERTLDHYGQASLEDGDRFELEAPTIGGKSATSTSTVEDWFAPAQFFTLSDPEKLSAPSFELMPGGLRFGDDGVEAGLPEPFELDYEQIIRDPEVQGDDRTLTATFRPSAAALATALTRSPAAQARRVSRLPASTTRRSPFRLAPTRFVVTDTATGAIVAAMTPAAGVPWSVAREAVLGADTPGRRQVAPLYEAVA